MTSEYRIKPLSSAISIAVGLACMAPGYSIAQEEGDVIEEIKITGSRIRTGRQAASIPVDTVTAEAIKLSGYTNVEDILNNMPQFVPERGSSTNSTVDPTATGAATVNLRGLGGQRTLVLVNGRRYTFFDSSQRTDINSIPASLIERVEVVTGGASAVYGSDAVGGVVNFILKDDFEGVELRSQFNQTTEGDGNITDISLTIGGNFADDKGNAVVVFNYLDRDPIMTTDRSFSSSVLRDVSDGSGGTTLGPGGSSFIPNGRFVGVPLTGSGVPGLDAALEAAGLTTMGNNGFTVDDVGTTSRPYVTPGDYYNYTLDNFLRVPQERYAITALADYDVSDNATVYFEGAFSHNETTTGFASSAVNGTTLPVEVNNPYIGAELSDVLQIMDANGVAGPANDGLVNLRIFRRLAELGARRNEDTRNAFRALFGVEGTFNDYDYNAYYSYTRSDNSQIQIGNASKSVFAAGILSDPVTGADPLLNPFGPNISAAGVELLDIATTNTEATELEVFGATISGDLFDMPAGPFAALIGTEWRSSSVNFDPDQALLVNDLFGFNATTATKGQIEVWELFTELRVPLLADRSGIESLNATAAYRYSDYDLKQTGAVNTFLGGLDWQVNGSLAFGAQFQRAIRAPSVGEAFGGQRLLPISATDPCAVASAASDPTIRGLCEAKGVPSGLVGDSSIQPNTEIPGLFGGNPNLNEEESDTFTLSAIITPEALPNLRVSIDYFDISIDDTIAVSGGSVSNVLDLCYVQLQDLSSGACQAAGRNSSTGVIDTDNPVGVINANVGSLNTSGIDLLVSYAWELDFGIGGGSELNVAFNATFVDELDIVPIAGLDTVNKCAGAYGRTCGLAKPETKLNTAINWTSGDLTLGLRHRWSESTTLDEVIFGADPATKAVPELDGANYFDLSFGYTVSDEFSVWGGIINVFDEDPPLLGFRQSRANTQPDVFSPTGAELFLGGSYKF